MFVIKLDYAEVMACEEVNLELIDKLNVVKTTAQFDGLMKEADLNMEQFCRVLAEVVEKEKRGDVSTLLLWQLEEYAVERGWA